MTRRRVAFLVVGILVLAALIYGLWPAPVAVDATQASQGPLQVTVAEEGMTRIADDFIIRAPIAANAERIEWEAGDTVEDGQTLVTLRPQRAGVLDPAHRAEAEARVAGARASLAAERDRVESARAEAEFANTELERVEQMFEADAIAERSLQEARTRARSAEANLQAAQHGVEVARQQFTAARTALEYAGQQPLDPGEHVVLESPTEGQVLAVYMDSEGPVVPGQELLSVGDPSRLEVAIDVLSEDAVRIQPGMPVRLHDWGGEGSIEARVRTVEPSAFTEVSALGVEEQRVRIVADILTPREEWEALGNHYRVQAEIILWEETDVLQIPRSAVFPYGDAHAVFIMENGQAQRRPITIGMQSGLRTQVLDGIQEGEWIVNHPDERIEEGTRIQRRE